MAFPERSPEQQRQLLEVGKFLIQEQGTGIVGKLMRQGIIPTTLNLEIRIVPPSDSIHSEFDYDRKRHGIVKDGKFRLLTATEREILEVLGNNKSRVVTHGDFMREIWGYENEDNSNLTKGHVSALRRKLEAIGVFDVIQNINRVGYRLHDEEWIRKQEASGLTIPTDFKTSIDSEPRLKAYEHPEFTFYPDLYVLKMKNKEDEEKFEHLTKLERDILHRLVRNVNKYVSHEFILEDMDLDSGAESIRTHVAHLRAFIHQDRSLSLPIIVSRSRVGYMLYDPSILTERERVVYERSFTQVDLKVARGERKSRNSAR